MSLVVESRQAALPAREEDAPQDRAQPRKADDIVLLDAAASCPSDDSSHEEELDSTAEAEQQHQQHSTSRPDGQPSYRDSLPDGPRPVYSDTYDDSIFDDFYDDDVMTHHHHHQPAAKKTAVAVAVAVGGSPPAPALPQKSSLRGSRLLSSFDLKVVGAEPAAIAPAATPHDLYLSSEEDASSSADDFSDYDYYESESEESQKSPVRRRSHEDTARVVSVVFSGKPSIIDLSAPRRSVSPSSSSSTASTRPSSTLERAATDSTISSRRRSISSVSSASIRHPPRTSSMLTGVFAKKPHFLSIDPFASPRPTDTVPEEHDDGSPRTPKTPSMVLRKTFSLVKKRSRPLLNNLANGSRDSLATLPAESHADAPAPLAGLEEEEVEPTAPTYKEVMRAVKKSSPAETAPLPPAVPSPKGRILGGFGLGRRRSLKVG